METVTVETLKLDGHDDAILGSVDDPTEGGISRLVYSVEIIINTLCERDDMMRPDAWDYYNFNIAGQYMGPGTPLYLEAIELDDAETMT